jgi:peptidoglycan/xylan/chitin deacetylase (PgdA/CDA1 family)
VSLLYPIRHLGDRLSQGWQAQRPIDGVRTLGAASKPWLRDGLAEVLAKVGATSPARFARGALTIITFHRVLPQDKLRQYPLPGLGVTPEQLEMVLSELAPSFTLSPVIEAFRSWKRGSAPERPPLAVSFDDGALDNHEHAGPVLERLGLRATFYVPVKNVEEQRAPWHDRVGFALLRSVSAVRKANGVDFDSLLAPFGASVRGFSAVLPEDAVRMAAAGVARAKSLSFEQRERAIRALEAALGGDQVPDFAGMMTWDHVRALHRAGHEIGCHSLNHVLLSELPNARVKEEVEASRRELGQVIGAEVSSFCYPSGSYDARVLGAVQAAGYECAVTTRWGLNRKQAAFELARCDMDFARLKSRHGEFSKDRLWLRLSGLQPGLPDKVDAE